MDLAPLYLVRCACSFEFFLDDDRNQANCPSCKSGLDLVREESANPVAAQANGSLDAITCPLCSGALWVPASLSEVRCDHCGAALELGAVTPPIAPRAGPETPPPHSGPPPPAETVPLRAAPLLEAAWPPWVAAGFAGAEIALAVPEDPAEPPWVGAGLRSMDDLAERAAVALPTEEHLLELAEDLMEAVPPSHRVPDGLVEFQIVRPEPAARNVRPHGFLAALRRLASHGRTHR